MSDEIQKTTNMLAQDRTDLALERTSMAADRTLMAWTRTSLSLISFGFTLYKFMEALQEQNKQILFKTERGAQNFGMTLIAIGIISLFLAVIQYWQLEKKINPRRRWYLNLTLLTAGFIAILGLLSLVNTVFNIGPF